MVLKRELINDPNSTLNKAAEDEPLFLLRAQDIFAAGRVKDWADKLFEVLDATDDLNVRAKQRQKYYEALALAKVMESWPTRKLPD
jgi:hypothetical protein